VILEKFSLNGRNALVTGSRTGLGAAIAIALGEAGANVVVHGRSTTGMDDVCAAIRAAGSNAMTAVGDVRDQETCYRLIESTVREFGSVDILVNNAGIIRRAPALEVSMKDWLDVIDADLNSVFRMSQLAARHMVSQKRGKIINVASLLSFQGGVLVPAYAAAKGAVAQLTKALANEWACLGLHVNAITPGYMATSQTAPLRGDTARNAQIVQRIPAGRWGEPHEVAGAAVFLASSASNYVNGHVLVVAGTMKTMSIPLNIRRKESCRWDLVSLGEVMLRLDPGDKRIWTARTFEVYEGGGEYNVARGLKRCFGLDTAIVTAFADNPIGRLVQDLIYQGGVDQSLIRWVEHDGIGRTVRNGLYIADRGFGMRAALACSDRGNTAVSQLREGDIDWESIFGTHGVRWFHTGGIFCGLSPTTPAVAEEAMNAARRHGTIVSYDLNYRESLWKSIGGKKRAQEINRRLAPLVDVMIGNEEDYSAALGFEVQGMDEHITRFDDENFAKMMQLVAREFPVKIVAATLRRATTATKNDWSAACYAGGEFAHAKSRKDVEIYDRVGGGDSFASGFIYGLMMGKPLQWAVECGAAHGALAMTTPGDTSMAMLKEVLQVMEGAGARIAR
jgi:2-dehydro-3-deoxygluconokinase